MLISDGDIIYHECAELPQKDLRHKLRAVIGYWLGWYAVISHPILENDASYCNGACL